MCSLGDSLAFADHEFTSSNSFEGDCEPMQDSRVSDHRTKINFDLMTVLNGGDLEAAVQVLDPSDI